MRKVAVLAGLILSLFANSVFAGIHIKGQKHGHVTIEGDHLVNRTNKHQVNFYVDSEYKGQTIMEHGRFAMDVPFSAQNRNIDVRVLEYYAPGKSGHYNTRLNVSHHLNRVQSESVQAEKLRGDRMAINGKSLKNDHRYQVNFYKNGRYDSQSQMNGGSFNHTVHGLHHGDAVEARVLNYFGNGAHKSFYLTAQPTFASHQPKNSTANVSHQPHIKVSRLVGAKIVVEGSNFQSKYDVNLYVNDRFKETIRVTGSSFSHPIDGLNPQDLITVKVLNFEGPGNHLEQSFYASTYAGSTWALAGAAGILGIAAGISALLNLF